jgi:3-oxoacyl-(acyl-carrier-protein) synthase
LGCTGPALTVSTACSSGAVALKIALELLRSGRCRRVLAGGADALCRLTFHGFRLLQLLDPHGARPFDLDRHGMTVAEGAGMLLLEACAELPADALAELRGGGLSCDAHHPTQPLPTGEQARHAMASALADAGIDAAGVDYVNLHGTGTSDNDAAEAVAVRSLFENLPALSSTKGLTGHPLAASGAIEAVIAVLAVRHGLLPANVGLAIPDPALGLEPLRESRAGVVRAVLSNSFGFGGNNAAVVVARPDVPRSSSAVQASRELVVVGTACVTGSGHTDETLAALREGRSCAGTAADELVVRELPARLTRRLGRLPRMVLALADAAVRDAGPAVGKPRAVCFGTAWGPLTETHDFLARLFASGEVLSSPTDFVGSVHNAPAGQVAMRLGATGPNVTATAGEASFEQALLCAGLLAGVADGPLVVVGADEAHGVLTPRIDPSATHGPFADGGGALLLRPDDGTGGVRLRVAHLGAAPGAEAGGDALLAALGGAARVCRQFGAVFVGLPGDERPDAERQCRAFVAASGFAGPVVDVRSVLGEFATVAAAAAVVAVGAVRAGSLPAALGGVRERSLEGKGILLLGLGARRTAVEVLP